MHFGEALECNKTLKKLNFGHNLLSSNGDSPILNFLEFINVNLALECLDISDNNISSVCGEFLREKLKDNFQKKGKLDGEINFSVTEFGLIELKFDGNQFLEDDKTSIESYLRHNKALRDVVQTTNISFQHVHYAKKGKLAQYKTEMAKQNNYERMESKDIEMWQAEFKGRWKYFM